MEHSRIWINGKKINLGTYDTAKEAATAYDRAVLKNNKSTTKLNFPDMVHNLDVEPINQRIQITKNKRKKKKVVKGAVDSTCDTTCGAIGLMCDSDAQTELNTNEKVKAAFAEAGYTCKSFHAARSYAGAPFSVPSRLSSNAINQDDNSAFGPSKYPPLSSKNHRCTTTCSSFDVAITLSNFFNS